MLLRNPAELLPLLASMRRVAGLDVGEKTIGVALSDLSRTVASPLLTIARKQFKADFQALQEIIEKNGVAALVVGYPINMNGTEGPRCQSIRQFARNVQEKLSIPILLWDERMSTLAVERVMNEASLSRNRQDEVVDKLAASYLLQAFLDYISMHNGIENP
jgi:putative Holliday junction resolvase